MSSTAPYTPDFTGVRAAQAPLELGNLGDIGRAIVPGFDRARAGVGLSNTRHRYEVQTWGQMIQAAERAGVVPPTRQVEFLGLPMLTLPGRLTNPAYEAQDRFGRRDRAADLVLRSYQEARRRDPSLPDLTTREKVDAAIAAQRQADVGAADAEIPDTILGEAGAFVGAIGAGFTDPLVLATMGVGASAVTATTTARTIAMRSLAEGALQAGLAGAMAPVLVEDAARDGFEYGAEEIALDVGASFILGGLVGAGSGALEAPVVRAAGRRVAATVGQAADVVGAGAREVARRLRDLGRPLSEAEEDAARVLERQAELEDASPYPASPEGNAVHLGSLAEAADALVSGRANGLPTRPTLPPRDVGEDPAGSRVSLADGLPDAELRQFAPDELKVDAARFQFKGGGDAEGVTDRLEGVVKWSPILSGKVVVWEAADGTAYIADGHQRLGLAKRAIAGGQKNVRLDAVVLKEVDGITAADARVLAALKNIVEGTGSAIDAAKVLRETGADAPLPLPPRSTLVRDARGLAGLSDDAFALVRDGRASPQHAALLGRLAPDRPDVHAGIILLLDRLDPPSMAQAESIIRQALALPVVKETQTDMFGELTVTRNLFLERAQVLDAAFKRLKNDRRVFAMLQDQAGTIEGAGNQLNRAENMSRAQAYAQALQLLQSLASRAGPVSDALGRAAERVARGEKPAAAAKEFVNELATLDLRDLAGTDGDVVGGGAAAGGNGRDGGAAPEGGPGGEADNGDAGGAVGSGAAGAGLFGDDAAGAARDGNDPALGPIANKRELVAGQLGRPLDELIELATANQAELNAEIEAIAGDLGVKGVTAPPKKRDRAQQKLDDEGYTDAGELTDLARGSFVVETPEQADAVIARLAARFRVFDKGWKLLPSGYLDRKLLLRFGNGGVAEIQVIPPKIYAYKDAGGHALYTIARDPARSLEERAAATAEMQQAYAEALAGTPFEAIANPSSATSGNSAPNSASDSGTPSTATLAASGEVAAPSGTGMARQDDAAGSQANATGSREPGTSTSATGLSSSSNNLTDMDTSGANIGLDRPESNDLGLDLGDMADPNVAHVNQQLLQLGAASPLRPGAIDQADVDGLGLFDAARSPDLFAGEAASGRAMQEFDDPDGAAAQAQADTLLHDLRLELEAARPFTTRIPDRQSGPPRPGEPFLAFRAGQQSIELENRNAGDPGSVVNHMGSLEEYGGKVYGQPDPQYVHVFEVVVDEEFGPYKEMNRAAGSRDNLEPGVGLRSTNSLGKPSSLSYSFGRGGFQYRHVASLPVSEIKARLAELSPEGNGSFDYNGEVLGVQALMDVFAKDGQAAAPPRENFSVSEGQAADLAAVLEDLDADEAALKAVRDCL